MGALLIIAKILLVTPSGAYGQEVYQIQVKEHLTVYKSPSMNSSQIRILNPGQVVTTTPRARNGFYRVTLQTPRGRPLWGYVAAEALIKSRVQLGRRRDGSDELTFKSGSWRVGGGLIATYLRQGESTFHLSDGSTYELKPFQSTSLTAGFFADYRHSQTFGLRLAVHQRQARFVGEARLRNSMGPSSTNISTVRRNQFLSFSAVVQNYFDGSYSLWWGGGGELSLGQQLSLNLNGNEVATSREDIPHYGFLFAALGVEAPLKKRLYWTPDVRVGAVITTSPLILYGEASLVLSYQL